MKDLINIMARQKATEIEVRNYYANFFSEHDSKAMFEVYDISREGFVTFPGKEGSSVMNLQTLIKRLAEMEALGTGIDDLLVIEFDRSDINFYDPVFIGSEDGFFRNLS